jgi:hypothetical protein
MLTKDEVRTSDNDSIFISVKKCTYSFLTKESELNTERIVTQKNVYFQNQ